MGSAASGGKAVVAVVIPAFNPGSYLVECLDSVLKQSVGYIEVVVVDDGSDASAFPTLPDDPRLVVVKTENCGVAAARNAGVARTSADLIAFLDADDRWLPSKLERQVDVMTADPDCVLCYTGYSFIDPGGARVANGPNGEAVDYAGLFLRNPIAPSAALVRRTALESAGGFDTSYSIAADLDLWLRLALVGPFRGVGERLLEYRMAPHGIGQLSGDPTTALAEVLSIFERNRLRSERTGDRHVLEAIAAGVAQARVTRSQQAIERFVDSVGRERSPEWPMLITAMRIHARTALRFGFNRAARSAFRAGTRRARA